MAKYQVTSPVISEHAGVSVGDTVYDFHGNTYGCASEDSRNFGTPFNAYTLESDGSGPFFTLPTKNVKEVE